MRHGVWALRGHTLAFLVGRYYDSGNCTNEFGALISFQVDHRPQWLATVINTREYKRWLYFQRRVSLV